MGILWWCHWYDDVIVMKQDNLPKTAVWRAREVVAGDGEEGQHDDDNGLAGALEMLPIPCTISCTPGLPAILLVNPPTEIVGGPASDDTEPPTPVPGADKQLMPEKPQIHNRLPHSSTLKRLSVTRMNFYMRYLQPKSRRATQRERKATKTLAIVLGKSIATLTTWLTLQVQLLMSRVNRYVRWSKT